MLLDAATNAISQGTDLRMETEYQLVRPSVLHKPKLDRDGDKWCALYGDNLQVGIAGFGDSPELAMMDFDREWVKMI